MKASVFSLCLLFPSSLLPLVFFDSLGGPVFGVSCSSSSFSPVRDIRLNLKRHIERERTDEETGDTGYDSSAIYLVLICT